MSSQSIKKKKKKAKNRRKIRKMMEMTTQTKKTIRKRLLLILTLPTRMVSHSWLNLHHLIVS